MSDEASNVLRQALAATQAADATQRKQGDSKINGEGGQETAVEGNSTRSARRCLYAQACCW